MRVEAGLRLSILSLLSSKLSNICIQCQQLSTFIIPIAYRIPLRRRRVVRGAAFLLRWSLSESFRGTSVWVLASLVSQDPVLMKQPDLAYVKASELAAQ